MLDIAKSALDALDRNQTLAMATVIDVRGPAKIKPGAKLLVREDGTAVGSLGNAGLDAAVIAESERSIVEGLEAHVVTNRACAQGTVPGTEIDIFVEVVYGAPTALIVGAGHIGQHLSRMAKLVGFKAIVVDDRPDFANQERFPEADEVIAADMIETLGAFPVGMNTYVVLVIRGHKYDEDALRQVINSRAAYIGMIGSRARAKEILGNLANAGVPAQKIDKVYMPVGLRIGAQTPEEIALSIMAEIVNVRRGGDAQSSRVRIEVRNA
ncbi:MAG: XdhC/CoxI family protein [Chloroflexi bacterium]|nr:XdhC/CoxI family protein [Chloroflexota bacterium]